MGRILEVLDRKMMILNRERIEEHYKPRRSEVVKVYFCSDRLPKVRKGRRLDLLLL